MPTVNQETLSSELSRKDATWFKLLSFDSQFGLPFHMKTRQKDSHREQLHDTGIEMPPNLGNLEVFDETVLSPSHKIGDVITETLRHNVRTQLPMSLTYGWPMTSAAYYLGLQTLCGQDQGSFIEGISCINCSDRFPNSLTCDATQVFDCMEGW